MGYNKFDNGMSFEDVLDHDPNCLMDSEFEDELPVVTVSRKEWGALPPLKEVEPLTLPVTRVGISFNSNSERCKTKEECISILQKMQKRDMEERQLDDIAFNWLVGEDGRVYEGRGWKTIPNVTQQNPYANFTRMIDVSYIGNFEAEFPVFALYTTFINFVRENIQQKNIIENYEMK